MRLEEAKRDDLVEQRLVERHLGGVVPRFELHRWIEVSPLRAQRAREAVAARGLVGEHEQEEVLVRHLLLSRESEAIGQRVEHARELEPAQDGLEIGCDCFGGHVFSSGFSVSRDASGSAY
jgi:hypothetical protein